jgi:hypothetical protein
VYSRDRTGLATFRPDGTSWRAVDGWRAVVRHGEGVVQELRLWGCVASKVVVKLKGVVFEVARRKRLR